MKNLFIAVIIVVFKISLFALPLAGGGIGEDNPINDHYFIELELGWNGYVGTGSRIDISLNDHFSINAGAGMGYWGYRLGAGFRAYNRFPYGIAFAMGLSYNGGTVEREMKLRTIGAAGIVDKDPVLIELKPVTAMNVSFLYSLPAGRNKIYLEMGYSFALSSQEYTYIVESGNELHPQSKETLDSLRPGGFLFSIGYAF